MTGLDVFFSVSALVSVAASAVAPLAGPVARARCVLVALAGVAGLLAALGAFAVAGLLVLVTVAATFVPALACWRGGTEVAGAVLQPEEEAGFAYRGRGGLLAVAFFALVARAMLIVQWPVEPAAAEALGLSAVRLPHVLVVALLLFCLGAFAATQAQRLTTLAAAVAWMGVAATVELVAVAAFVGGLDDAEWLAFVVVAVTAMGTLVADHFATSARGAFVEADTVHGMGTTLVSVLVAVSLVLLAGAW